MKKTKPKHRTAFPNTRKALRKEKRQQKKKHRLEHYSKKKEERLPPVFIPGRFVKRPVEDNETVKEPKAKKPKQQPSVQDVLIRQLQKEKNDEERLKAEMEKQRKMILLKANEEEDKVIKKLEKQLGLKKSKNKNNFFADDGLDYLLEICDKATTEKIVAAEKHLADVEGDSDFEEDLAVVTGKEVNNKKDKKTKKDDKIDANDIDGSDIDDMDNSELEGDFDDETNNDDDSLSCDSNYSEDVSEEDCSIDDDNDTINEKSDMNKKSTVNSKNKNMSEKSVEKKNTDTISKGESNEESDVDVEEKPIVKCKSKKKQLNQESIEKSAKISKATNSNSKEKIISEEDLSKVFSDDEVSHLSDDDDLDEVSNQVCDDESSQAQQEKPDVWEDIYGRKRDKEGNIIKEDKGTYIPPHLRNKESSSDKDLVQLKRQIKSVLNKLSGTNLHWACTSIENLYSSNSRNAVNTALTQLWLEATVGPAATPDRMVAEHAALVSVLHANVGSEIGAHFLQELCKKFDVMMGTSQPMEDKRLDNLVSCLAHLYSFKIYYATLVYDLLGRLTDKLSEKNIDCVLTALRCVGGVLRREEPAALKTFIHDTQAKVGLIHETALTGSRIKFLVEVLLAVKNNNLAKIPNYEPGYVEQLKKTCRGVVRRGNYVTTLNIRLDDLLKAEERGKWWVVGSAWEGGRAEEERPATQPPPAVDQTLLDLARKQRMNTDVRRNIFCVIMAAEDYMDAFEKLQQLALRGPQQREVVHVLLACCLQEGTYNPYYGVLAHKLCDHDRRNQLAIQYAVWDKIKELDSMSKQATTNLAQLLIHLILGKAQPLSILKIIQFSDLNKKSVRFMRQILLAIIMNADFQAALEMFHRISKPPKLHMFRESLRLFIQHFLVKNAGKKTNVLSEDEMATLKERTLEVDRVLTMHDTKLRL